MSVWILLLLLNSLWWGAVATTHSADASLPKADASSISTTITAKKMTVRNQDNKAIFEGSVVLTKGALVVHSDKMVVSFRSQDQSALSGKSNEQKDLNGNVPVVGKAAGPDAPPTVSNRSVSMIEATGRVKIEKEGGQATCQKAIYYQNEEKIILFGDPVAWQKGTRVSGKRITMFLAEDRSVVEGGSHVMIEGEGASR
ncbi:MAG: LptA/OstA family protein [Nitrospiraceae bacterium]